MPEDKTHKFEEKIYVPKSKYYQNAFAETVNMAREFESVLGTEKAHEIIRNWSEKRACNGIKQWLDSEGTSLETFEDFKKNQHEMWNSPEIRKTHTCKLIEEGPNKVAYEVTECIWANTFRDLDAADIGDMMMCQTDFATAKVYHPKIALAREKTLMDGEDCCDFTYTWNE